jgi:phage gpG-like protein
MGLTGDFRRFKRMLRGIEQLSKPETLSGLNKNLGEEALAQVEEGFSRQRDPYGKRWPKSIRAQNTGGQTLTDKARLRRSFSRQGVKASRYGFQIGSAVHYASTHQSGRVIKPKQKKALKFKIGNQWVVRKRVNIPQRMMLPEGELGPIWEPAFEEAIAAYVESLL